MNKILVNILFFFSCLVLSVSDPFLLDLNPHLSQGLLLMPLLIYSLGKYKLILKNNFVICAFILIFVTIILFSISGFSNFGLLYNICGTISFGLIIFNEKRKFVIVENVFKYFPFFTMIITLAYYLNFWDIRDQSERGYFLGHNENILSSILIFGLLILLFQINSIKGLFKRSAILIMALLHIFPIIATGSRTGIALLAITISIFIVYLIPKNFRFVFISFIGIVMFFTVPILISKLMENDLFSRFTDILQDDRFDIWNKASDLIQNNILTGVGFNNFNDDNWRIQNGLAFARFNTTTNVFVYSAISLHNSFLDLVMIGGIWLLIPYLMIIFHLIRTSWKMMFEKNKLSNQYGFFIFIICLSIFLFSLTGQAATNKYVWFQVGLCHLLILINKQKKREVIENLSL